jgi:hypothetical protein
MARDKAGFSPRRPGQSERNFYASVILQALEDIESPPSAGVFWEVQQFFSGDLFANMVEWLEIDKKAIAEEVERRYWLGLSEVMRQMKSKGRDKK